MVYSNARFRGNPINPKIRNRNQYNHPRIKYPPIFQNTINESNQFNVLITIKLTTIFFQIHPTITIIMQWYTRLWHNLIRRSIVSRITCNTTTQKKKKISFIFSLSQTFIFSLKTLGSISIISARIWKWSYHRRRRNIKYY